MTVWPLAKMSLPFQVLSALLYCLPIGFLVAALGGWAPVLFWPGIWVLLLYIACWLGMRPTCFEVSGNALVIHWSIRRQRISLEHLASVEVIDGRMLKRRLGLAARVGVGGLWGVFGLLWSRKAGRVSTWISRHDQFVWLTFGNRPPLLIAPEQPQTLVRVLSGHISPSAR